jgi:SEC-C motif
MTLILALGNPEHTVLLADCRHSKDTGPEPGEFHKALVLELSDARLAVAFTGLAEGLPVPGRDTFRTRFWLAEALPEASEPEATLEATVARFQEIASRDIVQVPVDKPESRVLSIFLAGYLYRGAEPEGVLRRVSNFEAPSFDSPPVRIPIDDFTVARYDSSSAEDAFYVRAGGYARVVPNDAKQELRRLTADCRPPEALVGKAVEVLQDAARCPESEEKISEQCLSIILPVSRDAMSRGGYHSPNVSQSFYLPGIVEARGGDFGRFSLMDSQFGASGPPQVIPKVPRNAPCPCGSGKKYKRCCGRPGPSDWRIVLGNDSMEWRGPSRGRNR